MIKTEGEFNTLVELFPPNVLKKHMTRAKQLRFGLNVKDVKPNELFAAGVKRKDTNLMKSALRKGATNANFLKGEAMMIAIGENDLQLGKMLLKHPKYSPTMGGRTQMSFGSDQAPLIKAATTNKPEFVKLLLKDKRVDPTTADFRALKLAINNKYWDVVEILVRNDKILDRLDPYTTRYILKKLTKLVRNDS